MGHWTLTASLIPSWPCPRSPYPWPRQTATVATTPAHTVPSRLGHPPLCKPSWNRPPLHALVSAGGGNTNSHGITRDQDEDEEFDMEQLKILSNKDGKLLADLTNDEFREACGVRIEVERPSDSSAEDHALLDDALTHAGGEQSDIFNSLSPAVKKQILILKELQTQHNELEIKLLEERAALEAKYQKLYEPLYSRRNDIVNGVVDIESKIEPQNENSNEENKDEVKGVPKFWLTVMKRNQTLAAQITDRDEDALKYLRDIKSCIIDNPRGFKLDFYFDTNPYFKNSVLTKTYHVIEIDDPIFEQAIGVEIDWYPGKCLTKRLVKKKSKKQAKNVKPVTKIEECESFFNFFDPPQVPEDVDNIDKETAEQLHYLFEEDYNIGSTIKDQIIPYAVSWFTGEAYQLDDFEDVEIGQTDNEED